MKTSLLFTSVSIKILFITRYSEYVTHKNKIIGLEELFNPIGVLDLHEISSICFFKTNVNVQNALHTKKRVHAKPRGAF